MQLSKFDLMRTWEKEYQKLNNRPAFNRMESRYEIQYIQWVFENIHSILNDLFVAKDLAEHFKLSAWPELRKGEKGAFDHILERLVSIDKKIKKAVP